MYAKSFTRQLLRQRALISGLLLLFALFSARVSWGQGFTSSSLVITASPTGATSTATTYYGNNPAGATPKFTGAVLSTIAVPIDPFGASGTLNITAVNDAFDPRGTAILNSHFYYRVYLTATPTKPAYTSVAMLLSSGTNQSNPTTYTYNAPIDLLAFPRINGGGNYTVDIYYDSDYQDLRFPTYQGTITDPSNGISNPYSATFVVKSPASTPTGATTTWIGTNNSTDWNLPTNWTNGVPNKDANALIEERPNCPEGTNCAAILYPILDDGNVYEVNNLTLAGQSSSSKGELTINQATLRVFGNLRQNSGGLRGTVTSAPGVRNAALNSTLVLAGANQVITGVLSVPDIIISGSGIKSVTGRTLPTNTLSFRPTSSAAGVIVQSAFENTGSGAVVPTFDTTLLTLVDLGPNGIVNQEAGYEETNSSYMKGVMRSEGQLATGLPNTFGNIGLDITANYTSPANVVVFRIVGDPLNSPTQAAGTAKKVPIKRQYIVDNTLDSENPSFSAATISLVFHYLDSVTELNTIPEANLTMFRSRGNGPPYVPVFGQLNTTANTLTRLDLPSLSRFTVTLGDRSNPLPVSLTAFSARRVGNDAVVTWQTASEQNNKGYEVQVSTNGNGFRTLGFVASATNNSANAQAYSYTDQEANKTGIRYYRLRQLDLNGTDSFYGLVMVSFEEPAASIRAGALAYPNPFNSTDQVHLSLESAVAGSGQMLVTDLSGRTIRQQQVALSDGPTQISVPGLTDLGPGIYMVKLLLPDGGIKTVKLQKL